MKIINYLSVVLVAMSFASCKQKYQTYDSASYIQFGYRLTDTLKRSTFYYKSADMTLDTVIYDVTAIGGPKDYDRYVTIEQVMVDKANNAIAGVHYKAFDSQEIKSLCVIKKDSVHLGLPIIMIRDNSLKSSDVTLQFRLKENEHFTLGEEVHRTRKLIFTDDLQQPTLWNENETKFFWHVYSKTKHAWMIEVSGHRWDDEFLREIEADYAMKTFWRSQLNIELNKKNLQLEAELKDPFTDENNIVITFAK